MALFRGTIPFTDKSEHFQLDIKDQIATITLNRPDKLNALTFQSYADLRDFLHEIPLRGDVRVIVIRGEGRAFSSGGDVNEIIGELLKMRPDELLDFTRMTGSVVKAMRECPVPIIAQIQGMAAGAGSVLALASDFRILSKSARFAFLFTKVGLAGADMGSAYLLPRIVGLGRANDLLLTSRVILAEEAMTIGLVNAVLPDHAALVAHAYEYARSLAHDVSSGSLAATKRQVALDLHRDLGSSVVEAAERLNTMMGEPAFAEGVAALNAKRPPSF